MPLFGRTKKARTEPADTPAAVEDRPEDPIVARTVDEQREFLLGQVRPIRPFGMQVLDVAGLTLCEDIASDLDLPPITVSRVDGYGVRAANIVGASEKHPIDLFCVGEVKIGTIPGTPLVAGACVHVAKGAPVPAGVDAVIGADEVDADSDAAWFRREATIHENLHVKGSELADGEPLLSSGTVLNPRSVALLAEVGLDKVLVRPKPRLVILTVNSTLVAPGKPLTAANQRYDSGTSLLTAAARADGATVYPVGVVAADAAGVRQTIVDQAIRADLIVVLSGTDADDELVGQVVADLGSFDLADVAVNRGARYGFGRIGEDGVPVVVVPGGAVSAFVGYQAFLRPMLGRLTDTERVAAPRRSGRLAAPLASTDGQTEYVPATLSGGTVTPVSAGVGSELAYDLHRANVLAVLPPGAAELGAGASVQCVVIDESLASDAEAGGA